jgi:predicted enzyme related to lactoylglutathione lyase
MNEPEVSLRLLVLRTGQPDQLRDFYQTLGIVFEQEKHGAGPVHFAGLVAGTVLEIYPLSDDASPVDRTTRLGFVVGSLDQVVERLRVGGTSIISAPRKTEWGDRAVVSDPDGRTVELYRS